MITPIWVISTRIARIGLIKTCRRSIFKKYNRCFTDLEGGGSDDGVHQVNL